MDEENPEAVAANGLEGVEVARTALSHVDGDRGRLIIAGHDVEDLAARSGFEDVCALLWEGRLPDAGAREHLRSFLGRARVRAFDEIPRLGSALDAPDAMDALRAAIAHLTADEGEREGMVLVTAAMAVFAAASSRLRAGLRPLAPDPRTRTPWTTSGWPPEAASLPRRSRPIS